MGMKKLMPVILIIVVLILMSFLFIQWTPIDKSQDMNVTSNPFLWRIERETPSYLYGSIHLAREEVLTLPDVVMEAIDNSDTVYTEVKLDSQTQLIANQLSMLTGQTLYDILPDDVINRLDSYLKTKSLSLAYVQSLKVWAVTSSLTLLDELVYFYQNEPLDQYIWNYAVENNKDVGEVESTQEQIDMFDSFTLDEQIELLNETLDMLEEYAAEGKTAVGDMLDAYIDGDLETIRNLSYVDFDENDPLDVKFYERVLTDRNINMSRRISQFLTDNPNTTFFFTIGAGHFFGDDGLITLLEAEGFTITRIIFDECEVCDSGEIMINQRCYVPYE
jgi:uncharacterized protein YbaP (TraB family)